MKRRLFLVAGTAVVGAAACSSAEPSGVSHESPQPMPEVILGDEGLRRKPPATLKDYLKSFDLVAIGHVTAVLPAYESYPGGPPTTEKDKMFTPRVFTSTLIEVKKLVANRGSSSPTLLRTTHNGGVLNGTRYRQPRDPIPSTGQRLLLFLSRLSAPYAAPPLPDGAVDARVGWGEGMWVVNPGDRLVSQPGSSPEAPWAEQTFSGQSLSAAIAAITAAA